jgi:hypothetical protein
MYQTTYHRPSSVDEAVSLFAKGSDAKYLAGGHTLIPVMKQRLAAPSDVIDLGKIKELVGIEASGDTLTIKAATTYFDIMQSADVKKSSADTERLLVFTVAPSETSAAGKSAAGSLLAIEPPIVPRWRTAGSPSTEVR